MAVGDVINDIIGAVAGTGYFQPSAGTEVMILSGSGRTTGDIGLSDGVTDGKIRVNDSVDYNGGLNVKLPINNTNYLVSYCSSYPPFYTGIQIK
jgi:hypothetical protein